MQAKLRIGDQKPASSDQIAALNGVRGLAIIGVLFVHSYAGITVQLSQQLAQRIENFGEAGVFGVDLFFVLSGYLITSILLRKREQPNYFRNFYARRFLRLFPLYYGYLALVALVLPLFHRLTHSSMQDYSGSWWWYLLYLSNWKADHGAPDPNLGHFWSLAVEEQFYLIWPAVVLLLSRRRLAVFCFGIIVAATLLRGIMAFQGADWNTIYRLTVTRFDTLAFGALTALAMQSDLWRPRVLLWKRLAGWTGLAAFVLLAFYVGNTSWNAVPIQLWSSLFTGVTFASLIAYAATDPGGFLTWRWLTAAGRYSYAVYVLHALVFAYGINLEALVSKHLPGGTYRLLASVLILVLSWTTVFAIAFLSGKYFEGPILNFKSYFENARPNRFETSATTEDVEDRENALRT